MVTFTNDMNINAQVPTYLPTTKLMNKYKSNQD